RRYRRLDSRVRPGETRAADHSREPRLWQSAHPPHLRPGVLEKLVEDAGLGVQPVPGRRRARYAETGDAAAGGEDGGPAADRRSRGLRSLHARAAAAVVTPDSLRRAAAPRSSTKTTKTTKITNSLEITKDSLSL